MQAIDKTRSIAPRDALTAMPTNQSLQVRNIAHGNVVDTGYSADSSKHLAQCIALSPSESSSGVNVSDTSAEHETNLENFDTYKLGRDESNDEENGETDVEITDESDEEEIDETDEEKSCNTSIESNDEDDLDDENESNHGSNSTEDYDCTNPISRDDEVQELSDELHSKGRVFALGKGKEWTRRMQIRDSITKLDIVATTVAISVTGQLLYRSMEMMLHNMNSLLIDSPCTMKSLWLLLSRNDEAGTKRHLYCPVCKSYVGVGGGPSKEQILRAK